VSGLLYQLRDDFPERLRLVRAEVTRNFSTALGHGIRSSPSLLLFHGGRLQARWVGRVPIDEVYDQVEALLDRLADRDKSKNSG
jgi:hypothetical protein